MTPEQSNALRTILESMFDRISKKQNIAEDLEQLEKLQKKIGLSAPPMLRHYLQRRSYAKALEFLKQGYVVEDTKRPDCPR